MKTLKNLKNFYNKQKTYIKAFRTYSIFRDYTMMPKNDYIKFISLIDKYKRSSGAVVECGVWRGGAIAGMAYLLGGNRKYYLFDSFEGLPKAKEIDGVKAINWQSNEAGSNYHNNCSADESWAVKAMTEAGQIGNSVFVKGWFEDTLPKTVIDDIYILRLDGDWYDSTMTCLDNLFPKVKENGLIIIDDYYAWDGCSKALHDYLSKNSRPERICKLDTSGVYLIKR